MHLGGTLLHSQHTRFPTSPGIRFSPDFIFSSDFIFSPNLRFSLNFRRSPDLAGFQVSPDLRHISDSLAGSRILAGFLILPGFQSSLDTGSQILAGFHAFALFLVLFKNIQHQQWQQKDMQRDVTFVTAKKKSRVKSVMKRFRRFRIPFISVVCAHLIHSFARARKPTAEDFLFFFASAAAATTSASNENWPWRTGSTTTAKASKQQQINKQPNKRRNG